MIAEARVLVTPDTTSFRSLLTAQVAAASKGVTVPVQVTPVVAGAGAQGLVAAERELSASVAGTTTALAAEDRALRSVTTQQIAGATAAKNAATIQREAAAATALHTRQLQGLGKGAGSAAASLLGVRGATLAATGPFIAGAAAAITFAKSIGVAVEFQKQLAVLQATSGATVTELQAVSEAAKQLGADVTLPAVSAVDAAQAMTELSKAGLSVQESIDGARGVLQLATAAGIDNAAATELAASALNAFGLAGDQAVHVADVLANSSNAAQGSITDIGLAMQQSAAAARQAGLTLEQTAGILTEFARAGIKGSDAGTSLRVLLLRLINPSKQASEIIQELGLHIRDATGNINLGFFDEFARKTKNLTNAERDRAAAVIAGQDAFRGLAILARTGGAELDAQIDSLNRSGTAAELAAARTTGLAGAAENLKNQLSTAGLALGQSLTPALGDLVTAAATAVGSVTDLSKKLADLRGQASKPVEFTFNLVFGDSGGDGTGFLDQAGGFVKDLVTGSLPAQVDSAAGSVSHLVEIFRQDSAEFHTITAQRDLPKLIADLNRIGASSTELDSLVRKLQAMEKQMQGGTAETEQWRKSFDNFIKSIQDLSAQGDIDLPIRIPPEVLNGTFGIEAAKATGEGFRNQLKNEDFGFSGFAASVNFQDQGDQAGKLFGLGWAKSLGDVLKTATASALSGLDLAVAQAGGNQGQELSVLREREAAQQTFLNRVLGRQQTPKNVELATKAAKNLQATRDQIQSIISQQQTAAKAAADKVTADAAKADQTFLGGLATARENQQNAIAAAANTKGVQDDITANQGLRALITRQIAQIKASDVAQKTKQAAIRALIATREGTIGTINQLTETAAQERAAAQKETLDAQIAVAQAEGNTALQIQLINIQIRSINQQIAAHKVEGAALNRLKAQRATLQQQREDLQDQRRSDQEALGQSIFDLSGNQNPLLKALNAEIADTRADIAAANKAGKSTVELQTALNGFLLKRKNLLEQAKEDTDAVGGTSLVDLFNKAQDILGGAGNVGFNASSLAGLSARPRIQAEVQQRLDIVNDPAKAAAAKQVASTDRLIVAIDQLTQVLTGNTASGTPITRREQNTWRNLSQEQRFYNQRTARQMVEQGLVG